MKNKVVYGSYTFQDDDFKSGGMFLAASLLSSQLQVNSFNAVVRCSDPAILDFERNSKLTYFYDDRQRGIFYVQTIKRAGPDLYEISATSTLGLLTEGRHMGGIYTGQTAQEVIADICGTVPFTVKSNLKEIKLYGWLPIAPPRDNLSQVLFAIGAALKTDLDGVLRIEGLWDGISGTVPESKMYQGANVDYAGKITQVIVNEHQYVPWTEVKQLFEGTAQEGDVITFDDPMHSLTADGFTILSSGANWAKVSAGSGVLSGKTYLHNTRQITKDVWPAQEPNVKTVKDATLVSLVNSQACADRLADYYKCREKINAPVVYHGEIPGDRLATYHPFDKTATDACLESTDITLSNTLKAQGKSLVGYVPPQIEQTVTLDNRVILTGSGTFVVPDGVYQILAVLIGGGSGGDGGGDGGIGQDTTVIVATNEWNNAAVGRTWTSYAKPGGDGGIGGNGGKAGKILQRQLEVSAGQNISYSCGSGGIGGEKNGGAGQSGGETRFGEFTTEDGTVSVIGFTDTITGETYAISGHDGITGGKGGTGGGVGSTGEKGGDAGTHIGHNGGMPGGYDATKYSYRGGGVGGGGASVDSDGGTNSETRKGADAIDAPSEIIYGNGGAGGNGGGGSGSQGTRSFTKKENGVNTWWAGKTIEGGKGAAGGAGAPGCIILYYGVQKKLQTGQLVDKNNKMILDRLGRRIIV